VGSTFWVQNEELLDAVTAVSGSGPAYVFYFIEALEESARSLGLDDALSRRLAIETYLGGARLAASTHDAPALLRQRVTSKRGTTESAISEFDRAGLKSSFIKGVKAACERAHELGGELGKDR
jgi:pyrroline-5-carboxylate reductase